MAIKAHCKGRGGAWVADVVGGPATGDWRGMVGGSGSWEWELGNTEGTPGSGLGHPASRLWWPEISPDFSRIHLQAFAGEW